MTDRFNGFTVVLEKDMRDDDAEGLIQAIRRLRGVAAVEGVVVDCGAHMAKLQCDTEAKNKIVWVLRNWNDIDGSPPG